MKSRSLKGYVNPFFAWSSAVALLICLFSGILLSFHYYQHQPLISTLKIEVNVPFGKYLRNLHYVSAQITLISLFFHLVDSIYKRFHLLKRSWEWFFLGSTLFILLFVTFTGYLLRADEMGELAGNIAENFLLTIPYIGKILNQIFFSMSQVGLIRVYHWHLYLSLFLVAGLFLWHFNIKLLFKEKRLIFFWVILSLPIFFKFPLKAFQDLKARGPWFFVGVQEMLKFTPPFLVFLYLIVPFLLFQAYVLFSNWEKFIHFALISYLLIYIALSLAFFIH